MSLLAKHHEEAGARGSVLDEYSNRVFKLVVLIVPIFFLGGNGTMSVLHYILGWYPAINETAMWISNAIDIIYMIIAIWLVRHSYGPDGLLIPKNLYMAKWILMFMVVMQWNINSYVCPFEDFWAFAPLFVIIQAFFFDVKLVRLSTALILTSMFISWIINGENLLPARNEFFYLNLIFRIVGLAFTLLSINIVAWFGKVFIIEVVASREKERLLQEQSAELEREARMKSDFLANMSHEIRTPMNAVIGMAEIAMREEVSPGARDCLTQIQKSGRNLLNIINDILDYSKIESGKMEIIPERYEPASELNDILSILFTRVGDKPLEVVVVTDTKLPHVLYGDYMRIRQVLINLANNAIKFTNEGRVIVRLECENTGEDSVLIKFHIEDTGIGIKKEDIDRLFTSFTQVDSRRNRSVEGTGLGLAISQKLVEAMGGEIGVDSVYGEGSDFWFTVPQKVLDHSYDCEIEDAADKCAILLNSSEARAELFKDQMSSFGVESARIGSLDEYESSGKKEYLFIELPEYDDSKRSFLDAHPDVTGVILVEFDSDFNPDRPDILTLRRPISTLGFVRVLNNKSDIDRSAEVQDGYSINYTAPDAKILVVDDNEINITVVGGLLAPMEIKIDSALSGKEAIEKVTANDYDIVLMDHMMPGMDGVDTTKIIREMLPNKQDLVIIALSANAMESSRQMFLEAGMDDFIAKPVEIKELVSKLKKWLPDEKVIAVSGEQVQANEVPADSLSEFDMLDAGEAVKSLGSPQLFRKIAGEYYRSGQDKYDGIRKAYEDEDIKDYTIRVHALKSSSRQIGAYDLGDKAEALENAGKAEDLDFIKANTNEALDLFKDLLDKMAPLFAEDEKDKADLPPLSDDVLSEQMDKLKSACEDLDMDVMEEVKSELTSYSWPADKEEDLKLLCKAIDEIDIEQCEEVMNKLIP